MIVGIVDGGERGDLMDGGGLMDGDDLMDGGCLDGRVGDNGGDNGG